LREGGCRVAGDFEFGFAVKNPDGADFRLGDAAEAAD
jgi:hypothetical protein